MIRTRSEIFDSPYDFELVKHEYDLFGMSLYEFVKTFYIRNKKAGEKIYNLKNILRIIK